MDPRVLTSDAQPDVTRLDFDTFVESREAWDELAAASSTPLPFMCHAWLRVWWHHFGQRQEFAAFVVRDGERLLAAAPLALRRQRWAGVSVHVAELVGTGPVPTRGMGLADKADLLVRPDAGAAATALAATLVEPALGADALDIRGCDSCSRTADLLAGAVPTDRGVCRIDRSASPFLPLPASWDDYLATHSGNFRKHLRKYRRNLDREGGMEIARMEPGDDPAPWIDAAIAVDTSTWKAERGTNLFRHPAIRAFMTDLIHAMAPDGLIDLHLLRVGGRAIAYELGFDFVGRLFSYNSGYHPDHARYAPGVVLTAAVIESAIARGRSEYDLLRGDEAYKSRWSSGSRREQQLIVPARGLRGWVHSRGVGLKQRLKRSPGLSGLADRISGLQTRLRH